MSKTLERTCDWIMRNVWNGTEYYSQCGKQFEFSEGTLKAPINKDFLFCPFCGGFIKEVENDYVDIEAEKGDQKRDKKVDNDE